MTKREAGFVELLSSFTKEDIKIVEENDLQYIALKKLHSNLKNDTLFIKLTVINALMAYQLQTTGEIYWDNFSKFFSMKNRTENDFEEFISIYSKRLINVRKKRLQKVLNCIMPFSLDELISLANHLKDYTVTISKCLNQKKESKTVVFSAKMLLYACTIATNTNVRSDFGIMIPLDSRIKKISDNMDFWKKVERKTSIPLLHIDSILWIAMGMKSDKLKELNKKLSANILLLKEYLEKFYGI